MSEPPEPPASGEALEGGDPVCWLHLVCESCGALLEREGDEHRPGCAVITTNDGPASR